MLRHVALSTLLFCLVICNAHGWALKSGEDHDAWMDDWGMEDDDGEEMDSGMTKEMDMNMADKEMEMDPFVDFLWKGVKHGDLTEEHAWSIIDYYKNMKHDDTDEGEDQHDEWEADMDMDIKQKKALEMLSKMLIHDGASDDYSMKEWKELLKHIMFSQENRQDAVIDMSQECTLKVTAKFLAPEKEIHLCGLAYTLPEVYKKIEMDGEEVACATTRHAPEVHIAGLHDEPVHDGLYTMIWADRAGTFAEDGTFDTPFLGWMVINIPGCDVPKGDVVKPYLPIPSTDNYQVFVYEQHDHIYNDFAISQYTESNSCRWNHRCHFQQAAFVDAYHLQQRAVGQFTVYADPYSAHRAKIGGFLNTQEECVFYLDTIIHEEITYAKVDTQDKMALKKAFHKYTSQYVCKEAWEDVDKLYLLKAQFESLVNKYIYNYTEDVLVPNFVEFYYNIGLKYSSEADSVELCGAQFNLPAVHRKVWLEESKWFDGDRVELLSSEIRHAPMVKIVEKEHHINPPPGDHVAMKDELFTLLIVDRGFFGEQFNFVVSPNTPYINWMIVNIKGGHIESGDEIVPYLAWAASNDQYVFLYRQYYNIDDLPMVQYTTTECRAENRCGFTQPRFVWDYDLELVGAGRYDIKKDVYGELYSMMRGNQTPNQACDAYLAAKKAKEEEGEEEEGDSI